MLKLKLQYFGHLMWRADSFERTLMPGILRPGRDGDNRGWDGWMASLTQWTWTWVDSGSWWGTGRPGVMWFMGFQRVRHDWATELNWYILWKQKHKFAWSVPKFKARKRFTKLFLMPSPWANFVLSFSKKSSFPQCQLPHILMKPALSKVYTHWLLVAYSCQNVPTKNSSEFVESE